MIRRFLLSAHNAFWLFSGRGLVTLLAALVVIVLLAPGLSGGFIFDDKANIADNVSLYMMGLDHVSAWRAASSFPYGPGLRLLPMLSFGLDYFRVGSFDPAAYKATNLAIHVVTFLVLAGFMRQLLMMAGRNAVPAGWLGLGVAMLWAIHPLQVSSVLYVVQRMQTMASLFMLLALWAYLIMRQTQWDGQPWGRAGCWVLVCWTLALASKEDAALLPAYTLVLELTVLRFAARNTMLEQWIKRGYVAMVILGGAAFVFWALPRYGSIATFTGRDFNSYERVLTQGRVLLMYLGQIVWPAPNSMPFYYDGYVVSRSWLQPVSTLVAWVLLAGLVTLAWWGRCYRPLFALGVLWFFAGHLVTSNVLGLELVFEHRNHFPMIGIVLAMVDGCIAVLGKHRWSKSLGAIVFGCAFVGCATGTYFRSEIWGDDLKFAKKSVDIAPASGRAWVELCRVHFELSYHDTANEEFDRAVNACVHGGDQGKSALASANAIILKSLRGDLTQLDWDKLHERLQSMIMTPENHRIAVTLVGNAMNGVQLDTNNVLKAVDIIGGRGTLSAADSTLVARFILEKKNKPEGALHHLEIAKRGTQPDGHRVQEVLESLRADGQLDLADMLERE